MSSRYSASSRPDRCDLGANAYPYGTFGRSMSGAIRGCGADFVIAKVSGPGRACPFATLMSSQRYAVVGG